MNRLANAAAWPLAGASGGCGANFASGLGLAAGMRVVRSGGIIPPRFLGCLRSANQLLPRLQSAHHAPRDDRSEEPASGGSPDPWRAACLEAAVRAPRCLDHGELTTCQRCARKGGPNRLPASLPAISTARLPIHLGARRELGGTRCRPPLPSPLFTQFRGPVKQGSWRGLGGTRRQFAQQFQAVEQRVAAERGGGDAGQGEGAEVFP